MGEKTLLREYMLAFSRWDIRAHFSLYNIPWHRVMWKETVLYNLMRVFAATLFWWVVSPLLIDLWYANYPPETMFGMQMEAIPDTTYRFFNLIAVLATNIGGYILFFPLIVFTRLCTYIPYLGFFFSLPLAFFGFSYSFGDIMVWLLSRVAPQAVPVTNPAKFSMRVVVFVLSPFEE